MRHRAERKPTRIHPPAGIGSIKLTFVTGLVIIAAVALLGTVLTIRALASQNQASRALAVATDQGIRAIAVSRDTLDLAEPTSQLDQGRVLERVHTYVGLLEADHRGLRNGDPAGGYAAAAAEAQPLLVSLSASLDTLVSRLATVEVEAAATGVVPKDLANSLSQEADLYATAMEGLVGQLRSEAAARATALQQLQLALAAIIVGLTILESLVLFRPAANRLAATLRERQRSIERDRGQLDYLNDSDELTGLANRTALRTRLTESLNLHTRVGGMVSVIYIDLNGFEDVNTRIGHEGGDAVLQLVARRLTRAARNANTVARVGGDEFAVVYDAGNRLADTESITAEIVQRLGSPYEVDGVEVEIGVNAGVAVFPLDADRVEDLLRGAGMALGHAKESGPNTFRFLTAELRRETSERHTLIDGLRKAMETKAELRLVYQPKVSLDDLSLIGVEALLRWEHPSLGNIPPGRFIPLAEESDLILAIDKWVLTTAIAQAKSWERALGLKVPVSVNISSRQFRRGDLVETIAALIASNDLDPAQLEVELTEGTLIQDIDGARKTLIKLRQMGVKVSVDDFGTGYSSLSYLKRFPVDILKIDRSFVDEVTEDADDAAISRAIVNLARSLRLSVIAEGVETMEQVAFLREMGCDAAQGFVISRPLAPDQIIDLVGASSTEVLAAG